jgi:hypothetical protein
MFEALKDRTVLCFSGLISSIVGVILTMVFPQRPGVISVVLVFAVFGGMFAVMYYAISGYMDEQEQTKNIA